MFQDLKGSKIDRPKILRFHSDPTLFNKYQRLFKNMLDLIGFTEVLKISGLQRFTKIPPSYFPCFFVETIENEDCFEPTKNNVQCECPGLSEKINVLDFQKC